MAFDTKIDVQSCPLAEIRLFNRIRLCCHVAFQRVNCISIKQTYGLRNSSKMAALSFTISEILENMPLALLHPVPLLQVKHSLFSTTSVEDPQCSLNNNIPND